MRATARCGGVVEAGAQIPCTWELYEMKQDRTELHDLASSRPELVREMSAAWEKWAARCDVHPWAEVSRQLVDR